ncbi:MAG: type IV secretion system protein [Rickettsiaceae bacterium]|nr:type IV secretion system protein [Rickettsiaceae bacterium]
MKIQKILLLFLMILLSSCSDSLCIDADDFGFSTVRVPAGFKSNKIHGSGIAQYVDWYDSGLRLTGENIYMVVKQWNATNNINASPELSAWCPWLGPSSHPPSLQESCVLLDYCIFRDNLLCTDTDQADILNAPCLLRHGIGLYFAATPADFNPNASGRINAQPHLANPKVLVEHLGQLYDDDQTHEKFYDFVIKPDETVNATTDNSSDLYLPTGGYYQTLSTTQQADLKDGKLYFKILDRFYEDNSGQYLVVVKSGAVKTEWEPSLIVIKLIKKIFFGEQNNPWTERDDDIRTSRVTVAEDGMVKIIFKNIVENPSYHMSVYALTILSLIYYVTMFLLGHSEFKIHEFAILIVKIIAVSTLLTYKGGWDFFNRYLFNFFIDGTGYLIYLVQDLYGSNSPSDNIVSLLLSPQLYIKLSALPYVGANGTSFGIGIAYVASFLISLIFIAWGLIYTSVVYTTCLLMIGMFIMLAPVILCFILFEQTREIFETWLRSLISYTLQPVVLFAGVMMMALLVKTQIYKNLGFRVCQKAVYSIRTQNAFNNQIVGNGIRDASLYYWKPRFNKHNEADNTGEQKIEILIPYAHYKIYNSSGEPTAEYYAPSDTTYEYCKAYECRGERYPSFPYLDPNNSTDMEKLRSFWRGRVVDISDVFMLLISATLLHSFAYRAPSIVQQITGGFGAGNASNKLASSVFSRASEIGGYLPNKIWESGAIGYVGKNIAKGGLEVAMRLPYHATKLGLKSPIHLAKGVKYTGKGLYYGAKGLYYGARILTHPIGTSRSIYKGVKNIFSSKNDDDSNQA